MEETFWPPTSPSPRASRTHHEHVLEDRASGSATRMISIHALSRNRDVNVPRALMIMKTDARLRDIRIDHCLQY